MTEDEMYDIIRCYEESERDYHERNIELEDENARLRSCLSDDAENARQIMGENAKLREIASLMAVRWLPNDVCMSPDEWHDRDERIRDELRKLGIEVEP